jgi:hypothetical protein
LLNEDERSFNVLGIFIVDPAFKCNVDVRQPKTFLEATAVFKEHAQYFQTEEELLHAFVKALQVSSPFLLLLHVLLSV